MAREEHRFVPVPEFSPDGRFLVLRGEVGTGVVWDLSDLPPRARDDLFTDSGTGSTTWRPTPNCMVDLGGLSCRLPAFAPDGSTLAVAANATADTLRLLDAATGAERAACRLADLPDRHVSAVKLASDGRTVAVTLLFVGPREPVTVRDGLDRLLRRPVADEVWSLVQLFDTATGRELARVGKSAGLSPTAWFSPDGRSLWTTGTRHKLMGPAYGNCVVLRWAVPTGDEVWWPAGLTVLVVLLAAADRWRSRRRPAPSTPAPLGA
jgi:WD40 repeat protein